MAELASEITTQATEPSDLVTLCDNTLGRLRAIWLAIGYSETEVSRQIGLLMSEVENVFSQKIDLEESMQKGYIRDISKKLEVLRSTHVALGQTPEDDLCDENATLLDQVADLQKKLDTVNETKAVRLSVLQGLQKDLISVMAELGDSLDETYMTLENDLRESRVTLFQQRLMEAKAERANRRKDVLQMMEDIAVLKREMGLPDSTEMASAAYPGDGALDKENVSQNSNAGDNTMISAETGKSGEKTAGIALTMAAIELLSTEAHELTLQKKSRQDLIKELRSCIEPIWDRLQIDQAERSAFLDSATGITDVDIEAHNAELSRMEALKKAQLVPLVTETRVAITALWDEMGCDDQERIGFAPMFAGEEGMTEDVLTQHEQLLVTLQERAVKMRPLLQRAEKREAVHTKRLEMEAMSKDPSRLVSRVSNAKLLLEEEKARNDIKKLPMINRSLIKEITEWEKTNGPFMLNGRRYLETLEESEKAWERYKEDAIAAKAADKAAKKAALMSPPPRNGRRGSAIETTPGRRGSVVRPNTPMSRGSSRLLTSPSPVASHKK